MAPSAVEVQTTTGAPDLATLKLQASSGQGSYKEPGAKFDADAEAGLKGHKAAKASLIPFLFPFPSP